MKFKDIYAPPSFLVPQVTEAIEHISQQPISAPKKGKREQCQPAKDLEQYIHRVIAETRNIIDNDDLSLSDHYIIETKAILLDEFCQILTDCGLDHDGMSYGDHLCITHSVIRLRRQVSDLKRTLTAFRAVTSDLPDREKARIRREAEQARQEAERQRQQDNEDLEKLREQLNNP